MSEIQKKPPFSRIGKYIAAAAAGITGLGALFMRSEYEKKHIQCINYRIRTDKLSKAWDGKKIIFLSDLHDNVFGEKNRELKAKIEEADPDIILIGGDMMVTKPWKERDFSMLYDLLKWLTDRYPVYYANGNHESRMIYEKEKYEGWYPDFLKVLQKCNVTYLSNEKAEISIQGNKLHLYGLDIDEEYYKKRSKKRPGVHKIEKKIGKARPEEFCLLLAHNPLYLDEYSKWGADLVLSGHFHGGTIRLPFLGGVMSPQLHFFSKYNGDYLIKEDTLMIISAGLGTHSVNIRLNNPAQLVSLTFHTKDNSLQ